jgi:hypothetical protein
MHHSRLDHSTCTLYFIITLHIYLPVYLHIYVFIYLYSSAWLSRDCGVQMSPHKIVVVTFLCGLFHDGVRTWLYNVEWKGDDLKGSGRGLIEALPLHLSVGTVEIQQKSQSGQPVPRLRFKPNTSRISVPSVTATATR